MRTTPWVTRTLAKFSRDYRSATLGLVFVALSGNTSANGIPANRYGTSLATSVSNELVQYDNMKLCPSDTGNTETLVNFDHFSKFAEVVSSSNDEYEAITTSRLLLQKWLGRHGTTTRMQSNNTPTLTAEVSNELMKASQITKVTLFASLSRTQGLVERENRTLLTLLRVF